MRAYRATYWRFRNWYLLPVVLAYTILYFIAYWTERAATRLNWVVLNRVK